MVELQELLDEAGLSHPCDLDLLRFFRRHPRSIMTSEQIAAFVGYDLAQIAKSLDVLEGARVLRRSLNPTHVGRLYTLVPEGGAGWLPALVRKASTPGGRRELILLLESKAAKRAERSPRPKTEAANHA